MLGPVVAGERLDELCFAGLAAIVAVLGELHGVVGPVEQRQQYPHASLARDVADDLVQVDVHEVERLLHAPDVVAGALDQHLALPYVSA